MSKPDETQVRLLLGLISSVDPGESGHLRGWQALMGRSQSSDLEPEDKQKSPKEKGLHGVGVNITRSTRPGDNDRGSF